LKYIPVDERDRIITNLQTLGGLKAEGRKDYLMMTASEVNQLCHSHSAIIGAHTHNHPALSILNYEMQAEELATSKKILETIIQKEIIHFSYPFGSRKDFNELSIQAAKNTGFKMVCANYYGQVHRWTNKFAIPRILVRNWNGPAFSQQMNKFIQY
jgi:peptidoglycan/xylan/chitin deacetylase (PgdA/CDA1 family)